MSAEAMGFVYRHSPYTGVIFAVHLAVADSVNDQNGNQFWMSTQKLATKARTTRQSVSHALSSLVDDGWLLEISRKDGWTVRYSFCFVECGVVYESRWGVKPVDTPLSSEVTGGVKPVDISPIEPKVNPNTLVLEFEQWWVDYPRKVGKSDALKGWKLARRSVEADVLVAGLVQSKLAWKNAGTEARFIPHPGTWLRQGRWEDEVTAVAGSVVTGDRALDSIKSDVLNLWRLQRCEEDVRDFINGKDGRFQHDLHEFYEGLCAEPR
jgi:hypothetical protein